MRLQAPSSLPRGAVLILALAAAVLLSYFSIRNAVAVDYADLQTHPGYERSTRLEPGNYRNWYLLGRYWQYNLEDTDAAKAGQAYSAALSLNPRSADVWSDLARRPQSEGLATRRRNRPGQLWRHQCPRGCTANSGPKDTSCGSCLVPGEWSARSPGGSGGPRSRRQLHCEC